MAYQYANIKNYLHGIAFEGRLAYAMWTRSVGTLQGTGEFTEAIETPSLPVTAAPMIYFAGPAAGVRWNGTAYRAAHGGVASSRS
jgi:hypothetical protein